MVPVVAHDDPDNRGHVGHRDRINGRAITQVRVRLGQHAVQVPRIRVRALVPRLPKLMDSSLPAFNSRLI